MSIKLLIYPQTRLYKDKSVKWARRATKEALANGAERVVLKFADGRVEEIPPRAQATIDAIKQAEGMPGEEAVEQAGDVAPGKPVGSPYKKLCEELTQLVEILK